MRDVLCAMQRFPMRHARCAMRNVLCAMRRFPMRHTRCAMRYATISMEATEQKQLTGAGVLVF